MSRFPIVLAALLATAVQAEPPGADTIIIHGNRIEAVLQHATLELPQGATVINASGKWVVPGLVDSHVHFFQSGNIYTRPDAADFNAVVPYAQEVVRNKARLDAGITVVMGTDAGNIGVLHGPSILREMRLMQDSGLTPLEVLKSATTNGAIALGKADDLGVIAPGRLADLVLLDADPLADSGNLGRIYRIIKDGRVYDPEELMNSIR